MLYKEITIKNELGLKSSVAARFVQTAGQFKSQILIESENKKLSKNWQILSWIAWCLLLLGVILTLTGYKLGINGLGWGGFVLFLLCSFVVPEQANDMNFHVKRRDETGFDDKN